jgi:hypothetical protein
MIQAAMKVAMAKAKEKAMDKAKDVAVDKLKEKAMDKLSKAGEQILSAPERMFDGATSDTALNVQPIQHHPLVQSQAQFIPMNQMQGMPMQGMPMQQANPYGSAMQNMGLMELLEQAARMR